MPPKGSTTPCPDARGRGESCVRADVLPHVRVLERAVEQLLPQLRDSPDFDGGRSPSALVSAFVPAFVSPGVPAWLSGTARLPDARPAGVPGRLPAVRMGFPDARQRRGR